MAAANQEPVVTFGGPQKITAPLSEAELLKLFEEHRIPDEGRQRIRRVREELPARATRSSASAGKLRVPSKKMGFAVEAEAFSTEAVAIFSWEYDADVLEFYMQPACRLKIRYLTRDGRPVTAHITPDALRIESVRGFVFTECKTEEELVELGKKQPQRFVRDENGWRSPPAEEAAAALGCTFEIRSTAKNNYTLFENLGILRDYMNHGKELKADSGAKALFQLKTSSTQYASAYDLIHLEPRLSADDLYILLLNQDVYFPLSNLRLSDQDEALFFANELVWRAHDLYRRCDRPSRRTKRTTDEWRQGDPFTWDGVHYEVVNVGGSLSARGTSGGNNRIINLDFDDLDKLQDSGALCVGEATEENASTRELAEEILNTASPSDLQEATWRYEVLFGAPGEKNPLRSRSARAKAYWLRDYREAEALLGNGFVGLLADRHGNRTDKADAQSKEIALEVIRDEYETQKHKTRLLAYGVYANRCKKKGVDAVSYAMFCRYIKQRSGYKQKAAREGRKAAYGMEPQYLALERTTPRHGTHSWHIGHIDHTPLPLEFVGEQFEGFADTVWLTVLTTAHDRKVRAWYLSFDEPSYRSCMMVARDCVRRHGRLPQMIVSDQGPEFNSAYWEQLLAYLDVIKRERPGGKAKFGSVCERLWLTTQTQFVATLLGAKDLVERNFRAISPEADPKRQACWILSKFEESIENYFDTIYHNAHHGGIDMTPNHAESLSSLSHGNRPFKRIKYDEQFIARTCPTTSKGTAKVQPSGLKINSRWYDGPELHRPGLLGTVLEIRYDPWDLGRAFAYMNGSWTEIFSEYYALFKDKTERQVRHLTQAMRLLSRGRTGRLVANAATLAEWLVGVEGQEAAARQARNDAEIRAHREKINAVRWCPQCLIERMAADEVFFSLLWSMQIVPACPTHEICIAEACAICGRRQPVIGDAHLLARCKFCRGSLVAGAAAQRPSHRDLGIARAVADVLDSRYRAHQASFTTSNLLDALRHGSETLGFVSPGALLRAIYLPEVLITAPHGRISLRKLVEIGCRLGVSPVDLVRGTSEPILDFHILAQCTRKPPVDRKLRARLLSDALSSAFSDPAHVTTRRELCARAGINEKSLESLAPDAARALARHNKQARALGRCETMETERAAIEDAVEGLVQRRGPFTRRMRDRILISLGFHPRLTWARVCFEELLRGRLREEDGHEH